MRFVVVVPVYRRPHNVEPLVTSFNDSKPDARLLFVASPEDREERSALQGHDHLVMPTRRRPGDWATKINFGYRSTVEDWIVCCGDDVRFHPEWDQAILATAKHTEASVIGTSDMNPRADAAGIYSPHPAVHRSYADACGTVDGPGQIMCEQYDHNFPDRELAATAIWRGQWAFSRNAVLQHLHPAFSSAPTDHVYKLGSRQFGRDAQLFKRRSRQWR